MSNLKKAPASSSYAQQELDKAEAASVAFEDSCKQLTLDRMNEAPREEAEPQTKLSSKELENSKEIYLKPKRSIGCKEKFNEKWRKDMEFDREYVRFIAENKEMIGETIQIWTRPYGGMPAEEWEVPTNKPVWGPRHLAEQIRKCSYHRLHMEEKVIESGMGGQIYGSMVADHIVQRLDAHPAEQRKSVFMGASGF